MIIETIRVGEWIIEIGYDPSISMFQGRVVNQPYPVVFMAPSLETLHVKIRSLVINYLGKAA